MLSFLCLCRRTLRISSTTRTWTLAWTWVTKTRSSLTSRMTSTSTQTSTLSSGSRTLRSARLQAQVGSVALPRGRPPWAAGVDTHPRRWRAEARGATVTLWATPRRSHPTCCSSRWPWVTTCPRRAPARCHTGSTTLHPIRRRAALRASRYPAWIISYPNFFIRNERHLGSGQVQYHDGIIKTRLNFFILHECKMENFFIDFIIITWHCTRNRAYFL